MHRTGIAIVSLALAVAACSGGDRGGRKLIQNKGSDTLVNVAHAWAEAYRQVDPNVAVAVSGGGTGTGIAALINGTVDLANASRAIHPEELEQIKQAQHAEAKEHRVAIDAVLFFVHDSNPLHKITTEQIACVYAEGGTCTKWTDLGVEVPGCPDQQIIRVSRQSNSGTYEYVRERVLGKDKDFKLGSRDMQGSKDVVDLVEHTPCAIGYSGLGYRKPGVRALCVSDKADQECVEPSEQTAHSGQYPLSRPLFMYTLGEAQGPVKAYLDWIGSPAGQKIVVEQGFVPLN
jgi:phosphate transport system substrate-binding protein